jgi:L-iditol 2-dehydrogenase
MRIARIGEDFGVEPAEMPCPALPERGALVRMIGCGLCGSDLDKVLHRKAKPGDVLGHEVVGRIEALAPDAPASALSGDWVVGDRIAVSHHVPCGVCHYCRNGSEPMCRAFKQSNLTPGGFSELIALSGGHLQHTAFQVPSDIDDESASCVEPLACVLRAVRRVEGTDPPSVLIAGLGFIGLLAAQVYMRQGSVVHGVDVDSVRLGWARERGFVPNAFHPVAEREGLHESLMAKTPLGRVDTVFLTAVSPPSLELALSLVRDGGRIVLFADARENVSIDPSSLYFREISVIPSYSPCLEDLRASSRMIFRREIDVASLVSHRLPLAEIGRAFELYRSGQAMKVFIRP